MEGDEWGKGERKTLVGIPLGHREERWKTEGGGKRECLQVNYLKL